MRQMGIKAQWVKPYTQTTIDSDFSKELHNILQEQFNPEQPDAVWVSDITYIWTFEGFVYLTSIMAVSYTHLVLLPFSHMEYSIINSFDYKQPQSFSSKALMLEYH